MTPSRPRSPSARAIAPRLAPALLAAVAVAIGACGGSSGDRGSTATGGSTAPSGSTAAGGSTAPGGSSATGGSTTTDGSTGGGSGAGKQAAGDDEAQIRSVAARAANAVASQDGAELCAVTDTSELESEVRQSGREDLVKILDEDGPEAVCEKLADQVLFDDQSAEEKSDARSFRVVSVKVEGDEATAQVRTSNDRTDATFRRIGDEWKFVQSTALE